MRGRRPSPHSVKDVLNRVRTLRQLSATIPEQLEWAGWLRGRLSGEIAAHLVSVVRRAPPAARAAQLILFADSAAWCARLRYAVGALAPEIRARDASIGPIHVRVLMNTSG